MAGRAPALEQTRRPQHQRTGADRGQIARGRGQALELGHERQVVDHIGRRHAAGDEQKIAAFDLSQPHRAAEDQSALGFDRAARFRGDEGPSLGDAAEHGVRAGEIQLGHARIDGLDDDEGLIGGQVGHAALL